MNGSEVFSGGAFPFRNDSIESCRRLESSRCRRCSLICIHQFLSVRFIFGYYFFKRRHGGKFLLGIFIFHRCTVEYRGTFICGFLHCCDSISHSCVVADEDRATLVNQCIGCIQCSFYLCGIVTVLYFYYCPSHSVEDLR